MILFFEDRYFTQMQSRWIYRHWGCITRSSYTKVNQQWHVGSWQVYRGVYKRMPRKRVQMSVWSLKKCPANLHQGEPSGGAAGHLPSEGKILEHEDATLFARGRSHSCAFRSTCIRKKKGDTAATDQLHHWRDPSSCSGKVTSQDSSCHRQKRK